MPEAVEMPAPVSATLRADPVIISARASCSAFTGPSLPTGRERAAGVVESRGMLTQVTPGFDPRMDLPGPSKPIRVEPIERPKPVEVPEREPEENPTEREPEEVPA